MEGLRVVLLGLADEVELEIIDQGVVALEQRQIDGDALSHHAVLEVLCDALAVARIGDALAERWEVVRVTRHLDVGEELAPLAHEMQPASQQIARGPHSGRVRVGLREHPAAPQGCDLERVDAVVLRLAAVDGAHVEGVAKHEGDLLAGAEVGHPVPAEHALDADHEVLAERRQGIEQRRRVGGQIPVEDDLVVLVEHAEIH